ncbi:hypothetical protein [Amycolatopsis japonica]|uniref:hypothetical protein n=1 Tax=Amycolatopsis japonica TaxID=208439 RepID=UPI0011DD0146|nr:hypothetical protein [Amycolatopsis japonica]
MAGLAVQETGTFDWSNATGHEWLGHELWDRLSYVRSAEWADSPGTGPCGRRRRLATDPTAGAADQQSRIDL